MSIKSQIDQQLKIEVDGNRKTSALEEFFHTEKMQELLKELEELYLLRGRSIMERNGNYRLTMGTDKILVLEKMKTFKDSRHVRRFGLIPSVEYYDSKDWFYQLYIKIRNGRVDSLDIKDINLDVNETIEALKKLFFDED